MTNSPRSSAPKSATPLTDALFNAIGQHLDEAQEAERKLFGELAEFLWTGNYTTGVYNLALKTSLPSRVRLEVLLSKAEQVRENYQSRLYDAGHVADCDFTRELSEKEGPL